MKQFWQDYDPQGYSLWHLHYEKYEGEGVKLSHTNNLCNGFLQRLDNFRKPVFARHGVLGEEPELEIMGVWMFRGLEIPQGMKENPQFEYHQVRKLDHTNEADKKLVEEYWTSQEGDKVEGKTLHTAKYHK